MMRRTLCLLLLLVTPAVVSATNVAGSIIAHDKSLHEGEHHVYELNGRNALFLLQAKRGELSLQVDDEPQIYHPLEAMAWEWVVVSPEHNRVIVHARKNTTQTNYTLTEFSVTPGTESTTLRRASLSGWQDLSAAVSRQKAIDDLQSVLSQWPAGFDLLEVFTRMRLANLLRLETRTAEALLHIDVAHAKAPEFAAWTQFRRGAIAYLRGEDDVARESFCQVLAVTQTSVDCLPDSTRDGNEDNRYWWVSAANFIGLIHHKRGELSVAQDWYTFALAEIPSWADSKRAQIINNIGGVSFNRGEFELALEFFDESYRLAKSDRDTHRMVHALGNRASVHLAVGDHDPAIQSFLDALKVELQEGDPYPIVQTKQRIGLLYLELNQLASAEQFLTESYEERRQKQLPRQAEAALALGRLKRARGAADVAVTLHLEAHQQFTSQSQVQEAFQARIELAQDYLALNRKELARASLVAAELDLSAIADARLMGRYYGTQGNVHLAAGELSEATNALRQALQIQKRNFDVSASITTSYQLAVSYLRANNQTAAIGAIEYAIETLQESRHRISNHTLRATYSGQHHDVYSLYIDLLIDTQQHDLALQVALNNRARVLAETHLTSAKTSDERAMLIRQLSAKSEALRQLMHEWPNSPEREVLDRDIASTVAEIDALESRALHGKIIPTVDVDTNALQASMSEDESMIVHWLGSNRSWVWQISQEAVRVLERPKRTQIETFISSLIESVIARKRVQSTTLAELGEWLLGPIRPQWKRVYILPHGLTNIVPYQMLRVSSQGSTQRLLDLVTVEIALRPNNQNMRRKSNRSALIVADPVYGGRDSRMSIKGAPSPYARLNGSGRELEEISQVLVEDRFEVTTLSGFDANKQSLFKSELQQVSVLHFATHGIVDADQSKTSGLVLSTVNPKGEVIAGLFSLAEIQTLSYAADLVVLSACETATGLNVLGEGPISLARAFLVGGARQVVASLWPVEDHATRALMREFYKARRQLDTASEALRAAQLKLSRMPRYRHPKYWSGFFVVRG